MGNNLNMNQTMIEKFSENLLELFNEEKITIDAFAKIVNTDLSEIYRYIRKECTPNLTTLIKIVDCFNYSIDYLLGYIPFPENAVFKTTPPFSQAFKTFLKQKEITRYRLSKDTGISIKRLDDWYFGRFNPSLDKLIIIRNHYKCTIDYILGREN